MRFMDIRKEKGNPTLSTLAQQLTGMPAFYLLRSTVSVEKF